MFAKGLREDTEFGDGSDTAEAITRLIINSPWRITALATPPLPWLAARWRKLAE